MTQVFIDIAGDFWQVLSEMSAYLLFGFFVAGVLSVLVSQEIVEKHLGGRGLLPSLKAAAFGVPLPLCSCGVIPVSMSLFRHGASRGSAIAFLLSTPQTGVDSILVTYSLLGPVFAVFRPLAALATGLVGGGMVDLFDTARKETAGGPARCTDECCGGEFGRPRWRRAVRYAFVTLPRDIGPAMLAGLVAAAAISSLVPDGFFAEKLGTGIFAMLVMMVLGIPVYVCATASVPVAAALMLKGLTPGAAIVFLMTGPATNAASFVTIWKTLGARTAATYILTVAGCALCAGLVMDNILLREGFAAVAGGHWMLPQAVKSAAAVVLLAILGLAAVRKTSPSQPR
jgi:uncharacterized membrane protein YraQ (UPF0718 family)